MVYNGNARMEDAFYSGLQWKCACPPSLGPSTVIYNGNARANDVAPGAVYSALQWKRSVLDPGLWVLDLGLGSWFLSLRSGTWV